MEVSTERVDTYESVAVVFWLVICLHKRGEIIMERY